MSDRKSCPIEWCTSDHKNDTARIRYHGATFGERTLNGITAVVVARWAERRDGAFGVLPHVSLITGDPTTALDLTALEARMWSSALTRFDGSPSPWLAEAIAAGAEAIRPHDEPHDLEHRVATPGPVTDETAVLIVRAATEAARQTLAGFDRLPADTLDAFELTGWVMRFRAAVVSLVESVETLSDEGYLS